MRQQFIAAVIAFATCSAHGALAQDVSHIRGTITADSGSALTVATRDGRTVQITLAQPIAVSTLKPVDLASIEPGAFVGTTALPGADGALVAREVHVFPPAARGTGEGHRPWDLAPGSTMTNATVTAAVAQRNGRELDLSYKGGSVKVEVPPGTPVVEPVPASAADLKPGAPVFIMATRGADGMLHASRVTVGKDGVAPPM